ncbi:MAG TPA: FKBP-type peptidyl-prolyl cis-trans isomerase [Cytophagaceae bacterium]|jgi:FKBP-type peptidyl-prolyl cis-trans isomerase|nr:FKBP-type peptidyl-prolyl cis-trans isomerase [Cytophagaceae bacterium]
MKKIFFFVFLLIAFQLQAQQDTVYTGTGLKYVQLKAGDGKKPVDGSRVKVSYTGKFLNGEVFEKLEDGDSFFFKIGDPTIIKGWSEGFKLMSQGEKGIFVLPPFLAYGSKGVKDPEGLKEYMIPPNATLVYEVELISVK